MLDLMVMCWSQNPRFRPSASQMVSIASAPEFTHLLDVVSLENCSNITCAIKVEPPPPLTSGIGKEWEAGEGLSRYIVFIEYLGAINWCSLCGEIEEYPRRPLAGVVRGD